MQRRLFVVIEKKVDKIKRKRRCKRVILEVNNSSEEQISRWNLPIFFRSSKLFLQTNTEGVAICGKIFNDSKKTTVIYRAESRWNFV